MQKELQDSSPTQQPSSLQSTGGNTTVITGKIPHHHLITTIQTFLMQVHHLKSPAFSSLAKSLTHLFHFLLPHHHCVWHKKTTNLIKVIGMRDTKNSIRSPCNYLPNLLDTHKRTAGGPSWGLKGHENLLPIKLST